MQRTPILLLALVACSERPETVAGLTLGMTYEDAAEEAQRTGVIMTCSSVRDAFGGRPADLRRIPEAQLADVRCVGLDRTKDFTLVFRRDSLTAIGIENPDGSIRWDSLPR